MRDIILEANIDGVLLFNIADLGHYLTKIEDSRSKRGRIYPLPMLITLIILAKLAGQDKPSGIASWIRERKEELWSLFDWRHRRMPCLNTIRTIMGEVVDANVLEEVFNEYLYHTFGGFESRLIAMDGKTMRGTIPKGLTQGVHLLSIYLPDEGVVLKQVAVETKENEISAAPQVLAGIPLKGRVLAADAMQTQRALSVDVLSGGGNYIWPVKNNQPTLRADVEQFFKPARRSAGWHIAQLPRTVAEETSSGHGRIETRRITLMVDDQQFLDWPGVRQVFMLEREVVHIRTKQKTVTIAYGITSCSPQHVDAEQLLNWTRHYWAIENGLHYRRDVTLHEDATRFRNPDMAQVMATLNNFIIGLTQKLGYSNLADARRRFEYHITRQLLC